MVNFGRKPMQLAPSPDNLEQLKWVTRAFANSHNGILITDAAGVVLDINPSFTTITGYERDDIIGQTPRILSSGLHDEHFYRDMWLTLQEQGSWQGEISNRRKDGGVVVELLAIHAIHDESGQTTHYVGNFSDLTRLKAHQQQRELSVHHDPLTQLPNRTLLIDRIRQAIAWFQRQGTLVALCCLDIRNMTAISKQHGDTLGNAVLVEVANRLKKTIREGDTVARLEGDRFAVLLSDVDNIQEVEQIAERIADFLAEPLVLLEGEGIDARMGLALYPVDSGTSEQLLNHAEQACRIAMQCIDETNGTSYYLFDPDQDYVFIDTTDGVPVLREALNAGEFQLHYQPILDLKTSKIDGLEAMLRWQHPERGLLTMEDIRTSIPYKLENSPLAIEFDLWALEQALAQMVAWERFGIVLPVSLNVSMRLLRWTGFQEYLTDLLARQPTSAPLRLELSMDDNAPLSDLTLASRIIEDCNKLGIVFVLDNFGAGYSSLTCLKYLPAQQIKIAAGLVRTMMSDPGDMAMVESILGLARAFKRKVIAQDVQTPEQANALWHRGCFSAQGNGITPPMPAADVSDWFAHFHLSTDWIYRNRHPLP